MTTLWYFPIEPLKSRYTEQLCNIWMPTAFSQVIGGRKDIKLVRLNGLKVADDVKVGSVLDAAGRGIYSLVQISKFLKMLNDGRVSDGDILFFQDFWTPGIEAIFYAANLMRINLMIYSMCHAQSFDIYDFTYPMREWIRPIEIAYANQMAGIFVASSVHKELLKVSGVTSPIHVVSLPISYGEVRSHIKEKKDDIVTFVSRLDAEKQPDFMIEVASKYLERNPRWIWIVSTSRKSIASNVVGLAEKLYLLSENNSRFFIMVDLSKQDYYDLLSKSKINFNCSLQDFVSWTLLEACIAGCDIVYPNYRSFPECVPQNRLYKAFDVNSAVELLEEVVYHPTTHYEIGKLADRGRIKEAEIVINGLDREYNIYQEDDHVYNPE